ICFKGRRILINSIPIVMNYGFFRKNYHRNYRKIRHIRLAMLTSKNEWVFYATRACVGAGLPYGAAEIIAQAGLYGAVLGGDAAQLLAPALQDFADNKSENAAFHQMLALNDRLLIARNEQLVFDCNAPLLVACAIALALKAHKNSHKNAPPVTLHWQSDSEEYYVQYESDTVRLSFDMTKYDSQQIVSCALIDVKKRDHSPAIDISSAMQDLYQNGIAIDDEAWQILVSFYRKTLVPSSEASRASGAGAGKIDND
nr:hypothetical protein [Alphaproteobacteria bacterium]